MDVWDAIQTKRAIRMFKAERLPEELQRRIFDAGRRAQSSKNTQPWHFIAVRNPETLQQLSQLGDYMGHVAGAAMCAVLVMPAEDARGWKMFDLGQSAAYMQLAAHDLGVGSCLGAIYQPTAVRELLGFPDDRIAYAVISFGYPHPDWRKTTIRSGRRALEDVVRWDRW